MIHVIELNSVFETSHYCSIEPGDIIIFKGQPTGVIKALATTYNINNNSCLKCVFHGNRCPVLTVGRLKVSICRQGRVTMVFQDIDTILEHI